MQIRKVKVQKAYVGASLDVIKAKAQQKPEVRAAAREHALRSDPLRLAIAFRLSRPAARPVRTRFTFESCCAALPAARLHFFRSRTACRGGSVQGGEGCGGKEEGGEEEGCAEGAGQQGCTCAEGPGRWWPEEGQAIDVVSLTTCIRIIPQSLPQHPENAGEKSKISSLRQR